MMKKTVTCRVRKAIRCLALGAILWAVAGIAPRALSAQTTDDEVRSNIQLLDKGEVDQVRKALPDLTAKYQNNAGVIYLEGRLATNGIEAVKFYQSVVDNFPKCEWADDALYRIYQYYNAMGLKRTAEAKLEQLKTEYPNSPHVNPGKSDAKPVETEETKAAVPPPQAPRPERPVRDTVAKAQKPAPDIRTETAARPVKHPAPAVKPADSEGAYALQVGAFSTSANAEKQKSFFEKRGYRVEVTNKVRAGRSYFLVWVGPFATQEEARRAGKEVRLKYKIDSMIVERQ